MNSYYELILGKMKYFTLTGLGFLFISPQLCRIAFIALSINNGGVAFRLIDNPLLSLHTQFGSLFPLLQSPRGMQPCSPAGEVAMMPPSKSPVMESAASDQNPGQQSSQQEEQSAKRACPLKFSIAKIMEPDHRPSQVSHPPPIPF